MPVSRTKDTYAKSLYEFMKEMLVVCPACGKKAVIKMPDTDKQQESDTRLICTNCGYSKRLDEMPDLILHVSKYKAIKGKIQVVGGAIDPWFHLPLWLKVDCCEHVLWAYNYEHLYFLKTHIGAKLRERNTVENSNKSIGSRLPKWMTSKNNRDTVLKTIDQLIAKK